ncbi:helix-turn-helix domain-containing protein [Mesorhizobium sp. BH1-1-5]|uniref:transcriptional regulator n=1 Tax=Mesorhizobium sp. BH1-1-5 TaxID=2876661 RepID=UPI001CCADC14|nr:YdaS family helix-turn-helix protein [Mesorhizobium sp. BH1-1-5]MBZ9985700.1 helix-turn-helix domain-containing protein [Mesorhizobium sp. BH1-1-5]
MEKLIEYFDAERGRRQALAAALGCSPSTISMWRRVPAERIGDVSRATGIPPEQLRPDIFGPALKSGEAA